MRDMAESTLSPPLSRRLGLALFRLHIENGITVALGMAVVGAGFLFGFGWPVTVLAYTGAVCASVVDQPARLSIKPPLFAGTVLSTSLIAFLAALVQSAPIALGVLIVVVSFVTALISVYGRRALGLGVAVILALVLGISGQGQDWHSALAHSLVFAEGGLAYALFALLVAVVIDGRNRRVVLGEALRAFASYLRAKADLFDPGEAPKPALRAVIESHGVLTENLQTARDMIYAGRMTPRRTRAAAALIALSDCFEMILSSDADIDILRRSPHRHLLKRMRSLTEAFARDVEALVIALTSPAADVMPPDHTAQLEGIASEIARLSRTPPSDAEEEIARAGFAATHVKFARAVAQLHSLFAIIHGGAAPSSTAAALDLATFMQAETVSPRVLLSQFTLRSPTMRYAIRLSLAMIAGYLLTVFFPNYVHGGWVLLTIALIMRANYSITRQRRNDRVIGTLLGCIVAAALIRFLPGEWPLIGIVAAVGVSHAFGAVNYRITALGASVSALLLLHYMTPGTHGLFLDRIIDTFIGAGLATAFSFLLPSWERRNVAQLVNNLLIADRAYAAQALTRTPVDQQYRLARKGAADAVAALSSATRRLLDEPRADKRALATLNELLSANYLLASDLASVQAALRARAGQIDPAVAEEVLSAACNIVAEALARDAPAKPRPDHLRRRGLSDLPATASLPFLRRRLLHIERSAYNVAALAARATR
jgi:uncharacterized membrane protein YccC